MSFFEELKRRNVFRVAVAYLITSWLLLQVADIVLQNINAPDWVIQAFMLMLGLGFPVALIFAWAFELTPEGIKKEKDVDRTKSITRQTGRKLDYAIIGVLAIAVVVLLFDRFSPEQDIVKDVSETAVIPARDGTTENPAETTEQPSIAVLPFVNMSSDAEQEYFSDGISEEILNALARVQGLQVAGRTSSFAFKGQNQDLRQIGETLGVDHILEGSVRKSGNTVRITAQLIRVDNGFHLWSQTYDRELTDVFAIQDEIAGSILDQLESRLLGGEVETVAASTRTDSEAYDLYLLAKQRMYERTGPTIEAAAELLDRAIALDPNYAPAYAQRGIATLLLSEGTGTYGEIPLQQAQAQGRLYLDKALQLDPDLAEAWAGIGLYHYKQPTDESAEALQALQKALELNPGLIDAANWLHNTYQLIGNPAAARDVGLEMMQRDPLYRPGIRNVVNDFNGFGKQEQALAYLERIRPLIPNDAVIQSSEAAVRMSQGQMADAASLIESAVALQPTNSVARQTLGFAWLNTHQYERVAEEGEEWMPVFALTYLGRTEEASILAFKRAEERADLGTLATFLNITGRSDELIAYVDDRWDSLDALQKEFPSYGALGYFLMLDMALAYSRAEDQDRFDDAMRRIAVVHQGLIDQGVDNYVFFLNQAAYLAMAGDREGSLDFLDRAVSRGAITHSRIAFDIPALAPLEGDPRYEAIQSRMIEHLNSEREKLGLEPATI